MTEFQAMMEETKALIEENLTNKDKRPSYMLEKQLAFIKTELNKMEQKRNFHVFYPYYPKGIIDSWDYSNSLAIKLMELLELYCKL